MRLLPAIACMLILAGCAAPDDALTASVAQSAPARLKADMAEDGELREQRQEMAMSGTMALMGMSMEFALEMHTQTTLLAEGASRTEVTFQRMTVMGQDMLAQSGMPATMLVECWPHVLRLTMHDNVTTVANPFGSCAPKDATSGELLALVDGLDASMAGLMGGPLAELDIEAYVLDRVLDRDTARYTYSTTLDLGGMDLEIAVTDDVTITDGRFHAGVSKGTATLASEMMGMTVNGSFTFDGKSTYTYGARAAAPPAPAIEANGEQ
jgi:hypothetical protein